MISTLCAAIVSLNPNSVIDVGYEEAARERVMRRFFLYPGSHDKITDCLLAGARMPRRLSPRTGGRCVGLGRRRPAGYQTGRVACVARQSQAGEAWRRSTASAPTALLPRFGSCARRRPSGPAQLCWARSRPVSSARIARAAKKGTAT